MKRFGKDNSGWLCYDFPLKSILWYQVITSEVRI